MNELNELEEKYPEYIEKVKIWIAAKKKCEEYKKHFCSAERRTSMAEDLIMKTGTQEEYERLKLEKKEAEQELDEIAQKYDISIYKKDDFLAKFG